MKEMRFGIIGCGMISKWHIKAIAANADKGAVLVGVTDANLEQAKRVATDANAVVYESAEKLIADPSIDAVCICTPSGTHAALAIMAARNGKHLVIEKPMSLTVDDGRELIDVCDKHGVKTQIISQLRFKPNIQAVKTAVDEGRLGRLVYGSADMKYHRSKEYYDNSVWRGTKAMDGGGALMNQGIHGVDILQYLMGGVRSACAISRTLSHKIEVEDTLAAILDFNNGALGHIAATTSVYPGFSRRIEISGEKGSVTLEEDAIVFWDIIYYPLPKGIELGKPLINSASNPFALDFHGHTLQIADLIDAVRENRSTLLDCRQGLLPLKIISAIYQAAKSGQMTLA